MKGVRLHEMVELHPTVCNICGGKVVLISNAKIYGREYGSGLCYFCTKCGAYVGTHEPRPTEALGIRSNKEMRDMKIKCHDLFDAQWKNSRHKREARNKAYSKLANKMHIKVSDCHFGYFDMEQLNIAYNILKEGEK